MLVGLAITILAVAQTQRVIGLMMFKVVFVFFNYENKIIV